MTGSALYRGTVRHRRTDDVDHAFTYAQSLLYLDLDDVDGLVDAARLWSRTRHAPGRFVRSDYLGDPAIPLKQAIGDEVERASGARPSGPVRLLCRARAFGHVFNPVTFAYCFGADGETVEAVVADVTNTPWGESHAYVLTEARPGGIGGTPAKVFHVSPLMGMDARYDVRCGVPGTRLDVHIESRTAQAKQFDATLSLRREPLDLDRELLRRPAESARVLLAIYTQALRLKLKGARWHPHPETAG